LIQFGLVWLDSVWFGLFWLGSVQFGLVYDLGLGVVGRVQGSGFRVQDFGFGVFGFRAWGLGLGV